MRRLLGFMLDCHPALQGSSPVIWLKTIRIKFNRSQAIYKIYTLSFLSKPSWSEKRHEDLSIILMVWNYQYFQMLHLFLHNWKTPFYFTNCQNAPFLVIFLGTGKQRTAKRRLCCPTLRKMNLGKRDLYCLTSLLSLKRYRNTPTLQNCLNG